MSLPGYRGFSKVCLDTPSGGKVECSSPLFLLGESVSFGVLRCTYSLLYSKPPRRSDLECSTEP
jgi:hypothetical protein